MNFLKSGYLALFACMLFMGCASYEKDMFRTVSFNAAETHWRSVLPFEFIKDTDKNQWHDDENVVFQVSIFTVPEGKEHKAWMENIKKFFFDKQKTFSVISDHPVSFKNWHGTKIIIEQDPDICTYWFLSDGEFFMFVSLIDREFQGYHPKLSDIDDFFLYLERDNFSHSEKKVIEEDTE